MLTALPFMRLAFQLHAVVMRCFSTLAHLAIGHPWPTLLLAGAVTLAAAPGLMRLKLRTDGHALVAEDAPEVHADKLIRNRFGLEDNFVVLINTDTAGGIFNPGTLQLVRELTAELKSLPGVNASNVLSLATEPSFHVRPGTLTHQKLLEPSLTTARELAELRDDLRRIELYTGTLVSSDAQSTCILLGAPEGTDRTQLYEQVLRVVERHRGAPEDIAVTGAPAAEALLGIHILEDLGVPRAWLGTSTRSHKERPGWQWPGNVYEARRLIARNIGLVPVAVLVMMLVFFATFRTYGATLLPLPEVGATLIFVFGLMGWCGVPIYLTIAVMPVLLTAMCVTDEIHVISRYFALLRERPETDHVALVRMTMDEMVGPVANTTLTTAIGFVSFACSPLRPVQAFGIFTASGVIFSLFFSLTVIPAMLALLPPRRLVRSRVPGAARQGRLASGLARLAVVLARHRWWVVALSAVAVALIPLGLQRLVMQDSWIDGFDRDSEFRRATELVNRQFYGMHLLYVSVETPQRLQGEIPAAKLKAREIVLPGDLVENAGIVAGSTIWLRPNPASQSGGVDALPIPTWQSHLEMTANRGNEMIALLAPGTGATPEFWARVAEAGRVRYEIVARSHFRWDVISQLRELAAFIRERRELAVGGVLGPYDYLETTRFMARPADPKARQLSRDPVEIKLMWDYYALARGPHRLRQIVESNYWQSLTTVFLKNANFVDTKQLMGDLRDYEREKLTAQGIKLAFAGDVAVSQSLIRSIVTTQLQSLAWSLVGIYLVTAFLGRSLRTGLVCVLPSTLAVAANFALMGWWGIPIGVATSMFAGMTLGIGVDFAIHLEEAHAKARRSSADGETVLRRAMALAGPPVVVNTAAIALGFGVLMLSQVPANARLGLLVVLGLVNCLLASLWLLPVLLRGRSARENQSGAP